MSFSSFWAGANIAASHAETFVALAVAHHDANTIILLLNSSGHGHTQPIGKPVPQRTGAGFDAGRAVGARMLGEDAAVRSVRIEQLFAEIAAGLQRRVERRRRVTFAWDTRSRNGSCGCEGSMLKAPQ